MRLPGVSLERDRYARCEQGAEAFNFIRRPEEDALLKLRMQAYSWLFSPSNKFTTDDASHRLSDQWHAGEEDACCKCPTTAHDEC